MNRKRKMLIAIALLVIIVLNCVLPTIKVGAATNVKLTFESNLYEALKSELTRQAISASYIDEQRSIIISEEDIQKVTDLSLSNKSLDDLTGLEKFTNISRLDLSSNELTEKSNLDVLNSLTNLTTLDLSSNQIQDVSMITNLSNIKVNLHNQKFNVINIVEIDTSTTSDQPTEVAYELPKILTEESFLKTEWLIEENSGSNAPYINWKGFDQKNIKVVVGENTDITYTPFLGMVTLRIKVSDSTSTLYNSDINMFFIVVDSQERGIYIKDTNMYNAIKAQLTRYQTINSELRETTNKRNLYDRAYSEPQVLVIDINDIVNKITSLQLSNKKIKYLDGIEKFVGLDTNLDLSGNYIKNIDKIIELQNNQVEEEGLLRTRVTNQLAKIGETTSKMQDVDTQIKAEQKVIADLEKTKDEIEAKIKEAQTALANLNEEKAKLETDKATAENELTELNNKLATLQNELTTLKNEATSLESENNKLKDKLNSLKNELADLNKQVATEEGKNATIEENISKKETEIQQVESDITKKQTDINNKQNEITSKTEEVNDVKTQISDKTTTISIYDVRLSEIEIELVKEQEKLDSAVNEAAQTQYTSMIKTEEEINKNTETIISNLLKEANTLNYTINEDDLRNEVENDDDLKEIKRVYLGYNNVAGLKQKVSQILETATMDSVTDGETTIDLKDSEKYNEYIERLKYELNTTIENGLERIDSIYKNADQKATDIESQAAQGSSSNDVKFRAKELRAKANALNEYKTDLQEKKNAVTTFVDNVKAIHTEYITASNDASSVLAALKAEKVRIQTEIDTLKAEINDGDSSLNNQKNDLEKELESLKNEKTALETEKSNLEKSLTQKREELNTLKEQLANSDASQNIADLKIKITEKEAEITKQETLIEESDRKLASKKSEIEAKEKEITEIQSSITKKQQEVDAKQKEIEAKQKEIEAKIKEIADIVTQLNKQEESIAKEEIKLGVLEEQFEILKQVLHTGMSDLYTIYNRIDKLASFATVGVKTLTTDEFNKLTFDEAKEIYNAQVSRILTLEKNLNSLEYSYLIKTYNIPTKRTVEYDKTVVNADGTTTTVKESKEETIENPISTYFNSLNQTTKTWSLSEFKTWIKNFRRDDVYFSMATYCYITRLYTDTTSCVASDYVAKEIARLSIDDNDTSYLTEAKNNFSTIIKTFGYNCSGTPTSIDEFNIAIRMVNASGEEINEYVCLPRLTSLNISENLIENIDQISELTELRKLYASDNEIVDISNVNWSAMTKLRILDLSFNGISDIHPLEKLPNIVELYLKKNLISGEFDFKVDALEKLKVLDLSENQINDIQNLINYLTYEARSEGYSDVATYLRSNSGVSYKFNNQALTMEIPNKLDVGETKKFDLPKIFAQIEEIDYANTSFGIDSLNGNVTSDGKQVKLDTTKEGSFVATVTIINTKSTPSLGSGTSCKIYYTVGKVVPIEVKITPDTATVITGKTQQFTAEVTGDNVTVKDVSWSVENATSEDTKISEDGLLTVGKNETASELNVIAKSLYDESKTATAVVTVIPKEVTEIKLSPESATVFKGEYVTFTATVNGDNLEEADKEVTWKIATENDVSEGTKAEYSANVLRLTIGKEETNTTFLVIATSKLDETKYTSAIVTVDERTVSAVTITPDNANVEKGKTATFTATVEGENLRTEDKEVTYTVEAPEGSQVELSKDTKITENGVLTVASDEANEKLVVKATSKVNTAKSATATVNVFEKVVTEVTITPDTANVEKGKTATFTATVNGNNLEDSDKGITYTVEKPEGSKTELSKDTKITENGVLTVASDETNEKLVVKATSKADNTKSATATVTVIEKALELGYKVQEDTIVGVATKTPIESFKTKLADGYKVVVKDSKTKEEITSGYMKTGMFVEIQDKDGNTLKDGNRLPLVYEAIVKGDVNGDGVADSLDSNLIKAYRNEVVTFTDLQKKAADIDENDAIDVMDSKLLLYHRAEVKGYCLDFTLTK